MWRLGSSIAAKGELSDEAIARKAAGKPGHMIAMGIPDPERLPHAPENHILLQDFQIGVTELPFRAGCDLAPELVRR